MTTVRARFKVTKKCEYPSQVKGSTEVNNYDIELRPVIGPGEDNDKFFDGTPTGQSTYHFVRKEVADLFETGKEYIIEITPVN